MKKNFNHGLTRINTDKEKSLQEGWNRQDGRKGTGRIGRKLSNREIRETTRKGGENQQGHNAKEKGVNLSRKKSFFDLPWIIYHEGHEDHEVF